MRTEKRLATCWVVATLLFGNVASAQAEGERKREASEHFSKGLVLVRAGALEDAVQAFEAAYLAKPHYSVLYNIGQAQLKLGRRREAAITLQRYLDEGDNLVGAKRRAEVQSTIASLREGAEPASSRSDHEVASAPAPAVATLDLAQLRIECDVPDMSVAIDEGTRTKTPVADPLLVRAGDRRVTITREGYVDTVRHVRLAPLSIGLVRCDERVQSPLPPNRSASIRINASPRDAKAFLDGQKTSLGALPSGPHDLRVERDGFAPQQRRISLQAQRTTSLDVVLVPTAEREARLRDANARRRTTATLLVGAGAALLTTAGSLFLWNQKRYDDWKAAPAAASDSERSASLQRVDSASFGFALLGFGMTAGGTWLFLSDESGRE